MSGISLQSLRDYVGSAQNMGAFVINNESQNQNGGVPEFQEASFLHKVKSFFGFSDAKSTNRATIEALKTAFRGEKTFVAAANKAIDMLDKVKGTITTEKLKSIISTFDIGVINQKNQPLVEYAIKGCLAAQSTKPQPFLKEYGFNDECGLDTPEFKKWYNDAATAYVFSKLNIAKPSGELDITKPISDQAFVISKGKDSSIDKGLKEFRSNFKAYIDVFMRHQEFARPGAAAINVKQFVKMCIGKEKNILVTTPPYGAIDHEKTLANVKRLDDLFMKSEFKNKNLSRESLGPVGSIIEHSVLRPSDISESMMDFAIQNRSKLFFGEAKDYLTPKSPTIAFQNLLQGMLNQLKEIDCSTLNVKDTIIGANSDDPNKVKDQVHRRARGLVFQCAIASLPQEERQSISVAFKGIGQKQLQKELSQYPNKEDLISLLNNLFTAINRLDARDTYIESLRNKFAHVQSNKILPD